MSDRQRKSLTRFEDRLVTITRAVMRLTPSDLATPLLFESMPTPQGLSGSCLELVCDALAHGSVYYLCKSGGWRRDRFLRDGVAVEGRLWHRTQLAERGCTFSRHALDFLIHVTSHHPRHSKPWQAPQEQLLPADQLLIHLTYEAFRDTDAGLAWRASPAFARNPLSRLHFPDDFPIPPTRGRGLDFSGWVGGLGGAILEVMQRPLEDRWLELERGKRTIGDWEQLHSLARAQDFVLEALLPVLESRTRRDLALFLLRAAGRYCADSVAPDELIGGLAGRGPARLVDRYAVHRQAAVLPRALQRLASWERQARTVSYLDEGYAVAQFWLQQWEAAGAGSALTHAQSLLARLEPIRLEAEEPIDEPRLSRSRQ